MLIIEDPTVEFKTAMKSLFLYFVELSLMFVYIHILSYYIVLCIYY